MGRRWKGKLWFGRRRWKDDEGGRLEMGDGGYICVNPGADERIAVNI